MLPFATFRPAGSLLAAACAAALVPAGAARAEEPVDFSKDVAPIFERHCVRCHRPGNQKGEVSLTAPASLIDGGYVTPGDAAASRLIEVVTPAAEGDRAEMPKEGEPLSAEQVETLRRWVAAGAVWPEGLVLKEPARADGSWWSLRPLSAAAPPVPEGLPAGWGANPIDRFIFAKLACPCLCSLRWYSRLCAFVVGIAPAHRAAETS
jgi:mono/diheme cytochrome c family protein